MMFFGQWGTAGDIDPSSAAGAGTSAEEPPVFTFVRHPRARRYLIRVMDDGVVRVTLPRWGSLKEAERFAAAERGWIDLQRRRLVEAGTATPALSADQERAYRAKAREVLPRRLLELAAEQGLSVARVSIRSQRWRWGSCSRSGHICLNWRLVAMPDWVRDYVLIHELMHLRRMDHSPAFWKLVEAACPAYHDARAWLRRAKPVR
jgi:predicted metal-dependent hydrolase